MNESYMSTWEALEYIEMIKHFTQKIGYVSILLVVLAWFIPTIRDIMVIELTGMFMTCIL
jgi:hypothetical protein